jgi:hypothetical protein
LFYLHSADYWFGRNWFFANASFDVGVLGGKDIANDVANYNSKEKNSNQPVVKMLHVNAVCLEGLLI